MALGTVLLVALLAGAAIPLGGLAAHLSDGWRRPLGATLRRGIVAFGGGVLVAAVALVLVPEGSAHVPAAAALAAFAAGGAVFAALDRRMKRAGGSHGQLIAMLTDFVPEALALGALLAAGTGAGPLLALLIGLQNLPEGFNAFEEARPDGRDAPGLLARYALLALLGPAAAWVGYVYMREHMAALGAVMLFAAGGILYLTFEDIAPEAHEPSGLSSLGAVGGFLLGLAGHLYVG